MINAVLKNARGAVAYTCLLVAMPAVAASITVTPATFASAVAAAQPGDTLRLVGTFNNLKIINRDFGSGGVKINAASATFTGSMTLNNVSNLYFGGGTFNITGAPAYTKAVVVYGGSNVAFNNISVAGSAGGQGVTFSGTAEASVKNSTFAGLQVGVVVGSVTNGTFSNNAITAAVSDGIDIADSHGVTASYNSCSAGNPGPGVHPDCIQLWSVANQPLQSGIVVSYNTATGPTQGFTAFATTGGESRVQIINNTVNTSFSQGIACYECVYSTISGNTLSTLPGSTYMTNLNVIGGQYNTVSGNYITPYTAPVSGSNVVAIAADPDPYAEIGDTPDLALLVGTPPADPTDPTAIAASQSVRLASMLRASGSPASFVPEPSHWLLLVAGFAAVGVARRRARSTLVAA